MVSFTGKKVGIWGLGIVGRSAVRYMAHYTTHIGITDKNPLPKADKKFFSAHYHTLWYEYTNLEYFLRTHDFVLPSPGVDLRPYQQYAHKWLSEVDIFTHSYKKPTIAITGSVGKTSIVHVLSQILTHIGYKVATGGNIGIGMLDLLTNQHSDYTILELSSFQLELSTHCAPDVAIITNIFPNHLDRHDTLDNYIRAKLHILEKQTHNQHAIVPYALISELKKIKLFERPLTFFSVQRTDTALLLPIHTLFFIENNAIVRWHAGIETIIYPCTQLPTYSFASNWLIIITALSMLKIPLITCKNFSFFTIPEHRLEYVALKNGITFYNDSKSTVPVATIAALHTLQNKPILLFLGGISKGIDRQPFIQQLPSNIKDIICFGAEASELKQYCDDRHLPAHAYATLEEAFKKTIALAQAGDCVLFSPAGTSYDLFKNYEERGNCFKKLVSSLA